MKHNTHPEMLSGDALADAIAQLHPSLRGKFVYDPPKRTPVQADAKRQRRVYPEGFETVTAYSQVDLQRVFGLIQRLCYGDCLTCGDFILDRQCCEQISSHEDDHAPDGALVVGNYVDYLLYWKEELVGVFEMRAEHRSVRASIIERIAVYLCEHGWTARSARYVAYGAITPPDACLTRKKRLLKRPRQAAGQRLQA